MTETDKGVTYSWGSLSPNTEDTWYKGTEATPLPASRDIVSIAYGGTWRMPSKQEWTELRDNTTWEYISSGSYFVITSKLTGGSICIRVGQYWVNDYNSGTTAKLANISQSSNLTYSWQNRKFLLYIRPVME